MSATGASGNAENGTNIVLNTPLLSLAAAAAARAGVDAETDEATRNARNPSSFGQATSPGDESGYEESGNEDELEELHDGVTKHNTVRAPLSPPIALIQAAATLSALAERECSLHCRLCVRACVRACASPPP